MEEDSRNSVNPHVVQFVLRFLRCLFFQTRKLQFGTETNILLIFQVNHLQPVYTVLSKISIKKE